MTQLLSTERANYNKDKLNLQETVSELQHKLQTEQQATEGKGVNISLVFKSPAWTFAGVEPGDFCQIEMPR